MNEHLLTLITFLPLVALVVVLVLPKEKVDLFRYVTLGSTSVQVLLAVVILSCYDFTLSGVVNQSDYQFVEKHDWIDFSIGGLGRLSADYFLAVDGLNVLLVALSAVVLFVGAISSWSIKKNHKTYFALYLLLSTSIMGCFVAMDILLFYIFFEFMLLPMYFLIGIWGGPRREYAAIKFFLYTLFGSIFILLVIIGLYNSVIDPIETALAIGLISDASLVTPEIILEVQNLLVYGKIAPEHQIHTFNIVSMLDQGNYVPNSVFSVLSTDQLIFGLPARVMAFLALFIGFAIKLPIVPLHTWLPDAHVEAPTPISVVLAGILLKIGGYGLIRIAYGIFPDGADYYSWWISLVAIITILYGAYVALSQKELKKMIAYSSVSHMGFVVLGIASATAEGVSGALYQMVSHGITSAMLFLIAGVLYDRTGSLTISKYQGLANKMPVYTAFVTVAFFASLGLPGFSAFISEIFVFLGAFSSQSINDFVPRWMVIVSLLGVLLSAAYYLWTLQRMFFGKLWLSDYAWKDKLTDLTVREYIMFVPLAFMTLLFGVFPSLILDYISTSVNAFVELF